MDNDSLSVNVAQAADSNSTDAVEVQMPTAEQLGISITAGAKDPSGTLLPISVSVGDTFDFPVTVSWSVNGSALLVVPTNSVNVKGLSQIGVSQESARTVKDGKDFASITFTYKIVAQDTGNLDIPVLKYEIPTPVGRPLEMRTESVPVQVNTPANWTPVITGVVVAIVVLLAGVWRVKRMANAKAALAMKKASENALREKMVVLKQRVNSADSRQWLLELEAVCKEFVAGRMKNAVGEVHLDALLKSGELEKWGSKDGWRELLEEFAHARYGGGKRDGFENKETWKLAMKLMGISDE